MSNAQPFPWKQAMRFGLGTLGLSPDEFWSMSLSELQAAMEAHFGASETPPDRDWLERAMAGFPDKKKD